MRAVDKKLETSIRVFYFLHYEFTLKWNKIMDLVGDYHFNPLNNKGRIY